jgi:hypothetical protein
MPFLSADRLNGLRGVAPIDQLQVKFKRSLNAHHSFLAQQH